MVARAKSSAWYDAHVDDLAVNYERLTFEEIHSDLSAYLHEAAPLSVLDVGCGTGRDAAAMAALGHAVKAVDPSRAMLRKARALHPDAEVDWQLDALPELGSLSGAFDVVLVSAVWMHVVPSERIAAMSRLATLTAPGGRALLTLRLGPPDPARDLHEVSVEEVSGIAAQLGLVSVERGHRSDLLGRRNVSWADVELRHR